MLHISYTGEKRNPIGSVASLDMIVAIGFGIAEVTHNGRVVVDGERAAQHGLSPTARRRFCNAEGYVVLRKVERAAAKNPRGRWAVHIRGPLWDAEWERKRPGKWVCTSAGDGFA